MAINHKTSTFLDSDDLRLRYDLGLFYFCGVVQDMLPPNMGTWHIEHFKLKDFEKRHVLEGLSELPLNQIIKPSSERCPLCTWRKGASLFPKPKIMNTEESAQAVLAKFPQFTSLSSYSLSYHISPQDSTLHQTWHKNTTLTVSLGLYFLMKFYMS